ncbi:peroxiredoxin [Aquimarina litoralis]|uniref:peroxiredoxin n=1 Tax=Aquimarina litoralis TaxID=584605 RepID=UPI001C57461D|nr:peroxiredoxin [Aquimarina litoralis]MBW1298798.1 redoxin domain-containing protein [Aquimarina litoralis]
MGLQLGDKVPEFVAIKDDGGNFNSKDVIGKIPCVLYFYPKNFTPGCIKEACDFRDSYEDFKKEGVEVIGISSDSVKSHERFKNRYKLPFIFLSDNKGELRRLFGVKPGLFGMLPGRETYVIDQNGIIKLKFNSANASKHLKQAIKTVKDITNG